MKEQGGYKLDDFLNKVYQSEKSRSVITFKLDPSMYNYVDVIVNRMRAVVVKDLTSLLVESEPSDILMQAVIASNFGGQSANDQE